MKVSQKCRCASISFEGMEQLFESDGYGKAAECPFVLPSWLQLWRNIFALETETFLVEVSADEEVIGVAPLKRDGTVVSFMGSEDLFDYQDMFVQPAKEAAFFTALLDHLEERGVERLQLGALQPDSTVLRFLPLIAGKYGYRLFQEEAGALYAMSLPATWQGFLDGLDGKQRHELRRKFRRFGEAGSLHYEDTAGGALEQWLFLFFKMFEESQVEKALFLNKAMRQYFKKLAEQLSRRGMLRPATLFLDGKAVAATFGFISHDTYYLYNSGYLPEFAKLSPGLLCKAMSIRRSIEAGMTAYNFLKGSEPYKRHLGGRAVPLVRLTVELHAGGGR